MKADRKLVDLNLAPEVTGLFAIDCQPCGKGYQRLQMRDKNGKTENKDGKRNK